MEVEPEREQRWERWLDSRTSDLHTSVQRWEGSRTQETRLVAQLGWGDLVLPSLTYCILLCQLQEEGEARPLPAGPLTSSLGWRPSGDIAGAGPELPGQLCPKALGWPRDAASCQVSQGREICLLYDFQKFTAGEVTLERYCVHLPLENPYSASFITTVLT